MRDKSDKMIWLLLMISVFIPRNIFASNKPEPEDRLTIKLFDFETQREIDKFKIRKTNPPTKFILSNKHVTSGKHSVFFAGPKDPNQPWPAAITSQLPERRFYLFKNIIVDVNNATTKKFSFDLYFNYPNGINHAIYNGLYLKPGQQTLTIRIPNGFNYPLCQLHIYKDRPSRDIAMYIDNMRLESEKFSVLLERASQGLNNILEISNCNSGSSVLRKTCASLNVELENLKNQKVKDVQWLADIYDFNKSVEQALRNHNKAMARKLSRRFYAEAGNKTLWYGWADGMQKIARNGEMPFDLSFERTVKIAAGRNEYEGVQIVLRSKKDLEKVRLEISDLTSKNGGVLSKKNVEILPVGYVNTAKTSPPRYYVDYRGWWPDPLLDFLKEFNISANKWQPVWLDFKVPADQKPGLYKGTVLVTSSDTEKISIPIELRVWNFNIPKKTELYHCQCVGSMA